jgi:hypothetical protein
MEERKNRRSVRLALVLGAAVAGTALVGWGGLAAWQAYTQNSGNAFSVGSLSHTNVANGGVVCTATETTTAAAETPCQVIVSGTSLTSAWTGSTGSVVITNTGALTTSFAVSSPPADAPTGALCGDLNLTVTGADSATPYASQTGIAPLASTPLNDSAGDAAWATGDSNTFTFSVTPGSTFGSDDSVPGESCSFDVLFTQSA